MITFKNGWTKETVIKHIKDNFKGRAFCGAIGLCMYLTTDGKKCAVGLFIPDGHPAQNSKDNILLLIRKFPDLNLILPMDIDSLKELQFIHDKRRYKKDSELLNDLINFIERES